MTAALEGGEWSAARPGCTLPPGMTRYPFYRRLGGPQVRSGRAENLVATGIRSRTFHSVAQTLYRLSYRAHMSVCARARVCVCVALVIQHAMRMRRFVICDLPRSTLFFPHHLIKGTIFRGVGGRARLEGSRRGGLELSGTKCVF